MIIADIRQADAYEGLHIGFGHAFDFLKRKDLTALAEERYDLDGDSVYATIASKPGRTRNEAKLEAHREYIDIHYALAGIDEMGWKYTPSCTKRDTEYNVEKDYELYSDAPDVWVSLHPGMFVVFFPDDAHMPLVAQGILKKVVIKIVCKGRS